MKACASVLGLLLTVLPAAAQERTPATAEPVSVRRLMAAARGQSGRGDTAGALESLQRARALAPNSEEVLSALAQVSLAARTPLPAIAVLDPLARMCPTVAQYHYLLGVALMQAGDMEAAVDALQRAERLEPNRALTLVALGLSLNSRKLYADAISYLRRGLELEPGSIEAVAALAEAQEGAGDLEQAEALARRALAKAEGHATANLVIGLVRMEQERYAEARDALLKAVAADPASARAHYQLSLAYARLGDEVRSQEHLELYRRRLREMEERVRALRGETGVQP